MKRQRRIETFYTQKNDPTLYFYVDWQKEPYKAIWLKEKPSIITFNEEVRWKEMNLFVILYANHDKTMLPIHPLHDNNVNLTHLSLVKSNLQKAIRRQLKQNALETARLFMKMDINQFIRRLFIIMLEDVMIHESMPVLVWLTAAVSRGFPINIKIESWLLSIVNYLCEEKRETYHSCFISNDASIWCTVEKDKQYFKEIQGNEYVNILQSLLFRKSYGGMHGDLAMIMNFIDLIQKTGNLNIIIQQPLIEQNIENINILEIKDIMPCAVDFHCYSKLISIIHEKYKDLEISVIKKAIWQHNSRFNYRVNIYQEDGKGSEKIWAQIEKYVLKLQRLYIKCNC